MECCENGFAGGIGYGSPLDAIGVGIEIHEVTDIAGEVNFHSVAAAISGGFENGNTCIKCVLLGACRMRLLINGTERKPRIIHDDVAGAVFDDLSVSVGGGQIVQLCYGRNSGKSAQSGRGTSGQLSGCRLGLFESPLRQVLLQQTWYAKFGKNFRLFRTVGDDSDMFRNVTQRNVRVQFRRGFHPDPK